MKNNQWNAIWIVVIATSFYFYFVELAGFFLNKAEYDPLIINFIVVPALFGLLTLFGLKGKSKIKALWFAVMPLVPIMALGQEADPAKPGLQWVLLAGILLPYCAGGFVMGYIKHVWQKNP